MKQKKKISRKVISYVLAFVMVFSTLTGIVPGLSVTAYAASATYIDGSGESQTVDATVLADGTTTWTDGSWYIVPASDLTISGRIAVNGTVNLILRDGATLTASAGITTTNATLNIYAQSAGTGALIATGSTGCAGIGGRVGGYGSNGGAGGTVSIFGGTVTATGGTAANSDGAGAGIGGGGAGLGMGDTGGAGGTVSIFGGTVTATGGTANGGGGAGAGIGGGGKDRRGSDGASGTLTLGKGVKLYNGTNNTGDVLDGDDSTQRPYSGNRPQKMFAKYQQPTGPDKSALNEAITAAETLYDSIKDNTDYTAIANTLNTAIENAQTVADNAEAEQDAVDAATTAITTAKTDAVIGMINKLPAASDVTTSHKTTIEAVRTAFESLGDTEKNNFDTVTLKKLTDAEAALNVALFNAYKEEQKTVADALKQTDDSAEAVALITAAKKAIDELAYDTAKTFDENKAAVTAIVTKLTADLTNQRAADAVIAQINELPDADKVTTSNKDAIEAARTSYNTLNEAQKGFVPEVTLKKLTDAEAALVTAQNKAAFDEYKNAQETEAEGKAETGDSEAATALINAAKEAIDTLTYDTTKTLEANKAAVDAVITQLETDLADQRAADAVIAQINELPKADSITKDNENAIKAARTAFGNLSENQEGKVSDAAKAKLVAVEAALKIALLPNADKVTADNKTAIEAARAAYNDLSDEQKAQVGNTFKEKLEAVEVALAIALLPDADEVTTDDKEAIEAARTAYDKLTSDQKAQVGNTFKEKLEAVEVALAIALLPDADEVTTDDKEAIVAAREAYNDLNDGQKEQVGDAAKAKLEAVETILVNAIVDKILSFEEIDEENMDEVKDALDSYDKVSDDIKDKIDAEIGRSGVKKLSDLEKALAVADKIDALKDADEITSDDEKAVTFARTAYELLNDSQKAMISEDILKKLEDAEAKLAESKEQDALADEKESAIERLEDYAELKAKTDTTKAEQEYYVDAVASEKEKINAAKDKDAVADALKAAKKAVDDALAQIDKDRAAAKEVAEKINALPESDEVTTDDKEAIEAARKTYDALTENQKKNIPADVLKKLTDDEKKLAELENKETGKTVDMYRLYNPNSGEHFYTASAGEKDSLVKLGWKDEGIGWQAPEKSNTPVYRLYNPNSGDHHYTTNKAEKDNLVSVGWKDEGIGWYSDDAQSLPIYRQYNPNAVSGAHNFTSNKGENDWLVSLGWKGEGIGWYGVK